MNMDTSTIWWSLLFGSIGFGYFMYGRKQKAPVPLICGIGMMIYPYFVSGTLAMLGVGGALMAIPFFLKL
jgi:hypothetical protein